MVRRAIVCPQYVTTGKKTPTDDQIDQAIDRTRWLPRFSPIAAARPG